MLSKVTRWVTWGIGGAVLLGILVVNYCGLYKLPDYILLTVAFCFGMYFILLLDTIVAEIAKSKKK